MELSKQLTELLNRSFAIHEKYIIKHIRSYREGLLQTIKETEIESEVDDEFILELVEQGFNNTLVLYLQRCQDDIDNRKKYMDDVKDLLNPD